MGILALFNKKTQQDKEFNPDSIVGRRCTVVEPIDNNAGCGQVKVGAQYWAARSVYDEERFEVGDTVKIVAIEGVRLVCVRN